MARISPWRLVRTLLRGTPGADGRRHPAVARELSIAWAFCVGSVQSRSIMNCSRVSLGKGVSLTRLAVGSRKELRQPTELYELVAKSQKNAPARIRTGDITATT